MSQPFTLQVVVDCASPHDLAEWWAQTLGWLVEPHDEAFIRSMIEQGFATQADTALHNGSMVWAKGAAILAPEGAGQGTPRVLFQHVPEAKTVKNRIHLDLRPESSDAAELDMFRTQLIERGATEIGRGNEGPHHWVTFADPEGNEFCV